jgi:hypothetical protein
VARTEWIERKWPRRLLLVPMSAAFFGWGVWLLVSALDAAYDGIRLARAADCAGRWSESCIVERPAVVAAGREELNRRVPDDYFLTLSFHGGTEREVQIAYESEWREHANGELVRRRTLGDRPLEVVDEAGTSARAAEHPLYRGLNDGLEAPLLLLMGLGGLYAFARNESRRARLPLRRTIPSWLLLPLVAFLVVGFVSFVLNLRPQNLALVAVATSGVTALWPLLQRSRMKP